MFRFIIYY